VFFLRIGEEKKNSFVVIRFEILLWLFGCENVSGPSRNGPVSRKPWKVFGYLYRKKRKRKRKKKKREVYTPETSCMKGASSRK